MLENIQKNFERLISLYEGEKEKNISLQASLDESRIAVENCRKQISELEQQIENLKLSQAFTSNPDSSSQAKAMIDGLVREIDKCISLLEK